MLENPDFRHAGPEDIPTIHQLLMQPSVNYFIDLPPGMSLAAFKPALSHHIHRGEVFVYVVNNIIVGTLRLESFFGPKRHMVEICSFAVDEHHRRKGYATAMMQATFRTLKDNQAIKLAELRVDGDAPGAHKFYRSVGFNNDVWLNDTFRRDHSNHSQQWFCGEPIMSRPLDDTVTAHSAVEDITHSGLPLSQKIQFSEDKLRRATYDDFESIYRLITLPEVNAKSLFAGMTKGDIKQRFKQLCQNGQWWMYVDGDNILACCHLEKNKERQQKNLQLTDLMIDPHCEQHLAVKFLQWTKIQSQRDATVKRLETMVLDHHVPLFLAAGFALQGTLPGRFKCLRNNGYACEYFLECSFFDLTDAIECVRLSVLSKGLKGELTDHIIDIQLALADKKFTIANTLYQMVRDICAENNLSRQRDTLQRMADYADQQPDALKGLLRQLRILCKQAVEEKWRSAMQSYWKRGGQHLREMNATAAQCKL